MLLVSFLLFENVSCLPQNGRCLLVFLFAASVNQTFKRLNDGELVASHELVKTVPKGRIL